MRLVAELDAQRGASPSQRGGGRFRQCRAAGERDGASVHTEQLMSQFAYLTICMTTMRRGDLPPAEWLTGCLNMMRSRRSNDCCSDGRSRPPRREREYQRTSCVASERIAPPSRRARFRGADVGNTDAGRRGEPQSCRSISYGGGRARSLSVRTDRAAAPSAWVPVSSSGRSGAAVRFRLPVLMAYLLVHFQSDLKDPPTRPPLTRSRVRPEREVETRATRATRPAGRPTIAATMRHRRSVLHGTARRSTGPWFTIQPNASPSRLPMACRRRH